MCFTKTLRQSLGLYNIGEGTRILLTIINDQLDALIIIYS